MRDREESEGKADSAGSPTWGSILGLRDHDLSQLSHPGALDHTFNLFFFLIVYFIVIPTPFQPGRDSHRQEHLPWVPCCIE